MKILKSRWFNKWAKNARIKDISLCKAIDNISLSSVVDLGGGLFKVRVPRSDSGKSGGFRSILIYKKDNLALFVLGFAKNEKDNINSSDLADLKKQAKHILNFSNKQIGDLIQNGTLLEVKNSYEK
jgi:hypothetical protein